jgi:hypothetical protein
MSLPSSQAHALFHAVVANGYDTARQQDRTRNRIRADTSEQPSLRHRRGAVVVPHSSFPAMMLPHCAVMHGWPGAMHRQLLDSKIQQPSPAVVRRRHTS